MKTFWKVNMLASVVVDVAVAEICAEAVQPT